MSTVPDFAGDSYRACLQGNATPQQQQSAAAQIILLNALKAELTAALEASTHRLHQSDYYGPCLCGQCDFVRMRNAVLAKVRAVRISGEAA